MINYNVLKDEELLELLSSIDLSDDKENEIKNILRSRNVEFEEFNINKSSGYLSPTAVAGFIGLLAFIIYKILRYSYYDWN